MHSPKIKTEIRAILTDPRSGKVIRRFPWKPANSLLKQFIQMLAVQISQTTQTLKDTGGVDRAVGISGANLKVTAALVATWGTVIGTGTTAVTMTDHKLETQVSANIAHAAPSFAVENPNASTWRLAISRGFTNNTGATLSVKEAGLYAQDGGAYIYCLDRTLYAVDVSNGITLTLTYRITVSL